MSVPYLSIASSYNRISMLPKKQQSNSIKITTPTNCCGFLTYKHNDKDASYRNSIKYQQSNRSKCSFNSDFHNQHQKYQEYQQYQEHQKAEQDKSIFEDEQVLKEWKKGINPSIKKIKINQSQKTISQSTIKQKYMDSSKFENKKIPINVHRNIIQSQYSNNNDHYNSNGNNNVIYQGFPQPSLIASNISIKSNKSKKVKNQQPMMRDYQDKIEYDPIFSYQSLKKIVNSQNGYGSHIKNTLHCNEQQRSPYFKKNIQQQSYPQEIVGHNNKNKNSNKTTKNPQKITSIEVIGKQQKYDQNPSQQYTIPSFSSIKANSMSNQQTKIIKHPPRNTKNRGGLNFVSLKQTKNKQFHDDNKENINLKVNSFGILNIQSEILQPEQIKNHKLQKSISTNRSSQLQKREEQENKIAQSLQKLDEKIFKDQLQSETNDLKSIAGEAKKSCSETLKDMDKFFSKYQNSVKNIQNQCSEILQYSYSGTKDKEDKMQSTVWNHIWKKLKIGE